MEHFPSPTYLLGAMLEDSTAPGLALKVAEAYRVKKATLSDDQLRTWLWAATERLGPGHPYTFMAVLAYPSDHEADRYAEKARAYGWKEEGDANASEPK